MIKLISKSQYRSCLEQSCENIFHHIIGCKSPPSLTNSPPSLSYNKHKKFIILGKTMQIIQLNFSFYQEKQLQLMAKKMGVMIIVLFILMSLVAVKGGVRHNGITSTCCRRGGAILTAFFPVIGVALQPNFGYILYTVFLFLLVFIVILLFY